MAEILTDISVRTVNIKTTGSVNHYEPILRINDHEFIKAYNDKIDIAPISNATFTGNVDFTGATVTGFAGAVLAGTYDPTPLINMINTKANILNPVFSGSVGINTSTPGEALDVVGNIITTGDVTASGNVTANAFFGDGSGLTNLPTTRWQSVASNTDNVYINNNGLVGIGTVNPLYPLHLYMNNTAYTDIITRSPFIQNENISYASDANGTRTCLFLGQSETNRNCAEMYFRYENNNDTSNSMNFGFYGINNPTMTILASGNVGIGSSNPVEPLDVTGVARVGRLMINGSNTLDTYPISLWSNTTGIANTNLSISTVAPDLYGHRFYTDRTTIPIPGVDDANIRCSINAAMMEVFQDIVVTGGGTVTAGGVVLTFTGQHRNPTTIPGNQINDYIGMIVSASNNDYIKLNGTVRGKDAITIDESLPIVSLSNKEKDKACFGVVSGLEKSDQDKRISGEGGFVTVSSKENGDNRMVVNSVGEGAIWVSNKNGTFESGDYITTSSIPGYGQKQDSDSLKNYTVAKITMDCDFEPKLRKMKVIRKSKQPVMMYRHFDNPDNVINNKSFEKLDSEEQMNYRIFFQDELLNYLDPNGDIIWDESYEEEYPYETRYLRDNGTIIGYEDYVNAKKNNENVYVAAFVGCTYHCG